MAIDEAVIAPTGEPTPRRRHGRRAAIAAAVVVAVVSAGVTLAVLVRPDAARPAPVAAAASCPASWTRFGSALPANVPAPPSTADPEAQLVPDDTPDQVLVCGYVEPSLDGPTDVPLSATAELRGDLRPLAVSLAALPRASSTTHPCAADIQAHDGDGYLVALTYGTERIWVNVSGNHCDGASNGRFTTGVNVSANAAVWLAYGQYAELPPVSSQDPTVSVCSAPPGRPGNESAMVPDNPISLVICVADSSLPRLSTPINPGATVSYSRAVVVRSSEIAVVARALNQLSAVTATYACSAQGGPGAMTRYDLDFEYGSGPGVGVTVDAGCEPPFITNGMLQATTGGVVVPLLDVLTRR